MTETMNEYVIMADGSVVVNAYVVKVDTGLIAVYVQGKKTFSDMSKIFASAKKTKHMESDRYGDKQTWDGYTEVTSVQIRENDACAVLRQAN